LDIPAGGLDALSPWELRIQPRLSKPKTRLKKQQPKRTPSSGGGGDSREEVTRPQVDSHQEEEPGCCQFPGDCAYFCPFTSTKLKNQKCTNQHQVFCLKGKEKSGTTWTEYLVKGLLEIICENHPEECKIKKVRVQNNPHAKEKQHHLAYQMYWGESHKLTFTAEQRGAPGCSKHAPPTPQNQSDNANILVLRDPRDTIVSFHFFQGNHQQFVPTTYIFSQLARQKTFFTKVHDSYKFMRNSNVGAMAFVRYEELNKNSVEAIRQLFDFLPVSCLTDWDERFAQELYDRYSFDSMAKAEDKGQVKGGHPGGGDQKKVRSGLSFGFAEHIQPAVLRQVDTRLRSDAIFDPLFERYYESEMIALEEKKAASTAMSVDSSTNRGQLINFEEDANTVTAPLESMSDGGRLIALEEATNAATMSMESTSNGAERL